jgi:hypothetical protein
VQGPGQGRSAFGRAPVAYGYVIGAAETGPSDSAYEERIRLAIECLTAATPEGYKDYVNIETDPELAVLRGQPAFRDLIARIRQQAESK